MIKKTNIFILVLAGLLIISIFLNIYLIVVFNKRDQSSSPRQFIPEQISPTLPALPENKVKNINSNINSFEECAKAGYPIMQTYPAQCKSPDGRSFTEPVSQ